MVLEIPGDRNVIKKAAEKFLKYKNLIVEIQKVWNVKTKVLPGITGATGTISKSLGQYLSNIPQMHEIKKIKIKKKKQPYCALPTNCGKC